NNDTLFDHSVDDRPASISAAEAARLLVACQGYAMGGRVSYEHKQHGSAHAGPLVKGALVVVQGDSLFQTMMLNLCWYNEHGEPFPFERERDKPAWDRDRAPEACDRNI